MKKLLLAVTMLAGCSAPPVFTSDEAYTLGIGLHERNDRYVLRYLIGVDPQKVAWCAAYVDYVLHTHGIRGTRSLAAKSYLRWGYKVREPMLWDVVVFERNGPGWEGHVGFYMGELTVNGIRYFQILGGNQHDAVTIELYPVSDVLGIRRAFL